MLKGFGGLGGLGDMAKMMKSAQEMQGKLVELQEELASRLAESTGRFESLFNATFEGVAVQQEVSTRSSTR